MPTVCEGLRNARVLVVDDEPDVRQILKDILEGGGARAACVGSGEEAVDQFKTGNYDLVWLDVRLPGMDGLTALQRLLDIDPLARVVLMTAYGDANVFGDAAFLSAASIVKKPFSQRQVLAISESTLAS